MNTSKGTLWRVVDILKGDLGEVLPKEETRNLIVQIHFAQDTLVQNEKD